MSVCSLLASVRCSSSSFPCRVMQLTASSNSSFTEQAEIFAEQGTKGRGGLTSSIISCWTEGMLSIQEEFEGWILGAGSVVIVCMLWALYSTQWAEC